MKVKSGAKMYLGAQCEIKEVTLLGSQCPISVHPTMENQGWTWGPCPEILAMLKLSPLESVQAAVGSRQPLDPHGCYKENS